MSTSGNCRTPHQDAALPLPIKAPAFRGQEQLHSALRWVLIFTVVLFPLFITPSSFAATPPANDSDVIFNYAEAVYPQFLSPAGATSQSAGIYYFRYYPGTNAYVATANGRFYYLGPASNNQILDLGAASDWLTGSMGLLSGAVSYTGPYPAVGPISYTTKDGSNVTVEGFPGQVQVFVALSVTESAARLGIQSLGGSVLAQIPKMGYYLAGVAASGESAFITAIRQSPAVVDALPNMPGSAAADPIALDDSWWRTNRPVPLNVPPGVIIVDTQRGPTGHAQRVGESLTGQGGSISTVLISDDDNGQVSTDKIVASIAASAAGRSIFTPNEPILINLSISSGGNTCNWGAGCGDTQQSTTQRHENWRGFAETVLNTIGNLPSATQDNLILTTALGNGAADLTADFARLRTNPAFDRIIDKNIQFAQAAASDTIPVSWRPGGLYSNTAQDLSVVRITGLIRDSTGALVDAGTSFSSPRIAAVTEQLMKSVTGLKPDQAKLANILAQNANASGTLVLSEAISRANSIKTTTAQIISQTGVTETQARSAMLLAVKTNATNTLVLEEAVAKAQAIKTAGSTDSSGALNVTGIAFTSVGGSTSAIITPAIGGVTVQYSVSGTDGYFDSGSLQTDSFGRVSFYIPSGAPGVMDTISVTAVLSGRVVRTTYRW